MTPLFEAILRISVEAAVLCALVLIARLIVGRRPGRMLTVLYVLIAIRLVVPVAVSSPLSVHNIFREPQQQLVAVFNENQTEIVNDLQTPNLAVVQNDLPRKDTAVLNTVSTPDAISLSSTESLTMADIAALVWAVGMVAMTGTILTGNALFMRRIRRNRSYDDPHFLTLLDECKKSLGLKRRIRTIRANETGTAAVYGVFRPVLLISPSSFESLSEAQQRHVLLHELSHIRRRDTLVCAGATVLNIMHWFNPSVWLVFALMRRDIEVQCDAHVFRGLPGAERTDYAGTLLKLAGPVQTPKLAPALFISKANIKRRIVMIIKHKNKSALFTAVALLLTVIVAVTGCTTAVEQKAEAVPPEPSPSAVAAAEATPAPIPQGYKLIGTYTLDYNNFTDDTACVNNIKKAAALLDGTVLPFDKELILSDRFLPLTVENGWLNAPWTSWETTIVDNFPTINSIQGSEDMQVGGGIELVMLAIRLAANKHVSYLSSWTIDNKNLITEGSFNVKNESYSDAILRVSTENNAITASLYGPDDPNAYKTEPELMSSFTLDNSRHNNTNRMTNIQKAADMINGIVIKPGETFSMNNALGPRNASSGWKEAAGIEDAAYVSEIGGGICAVSSALYNAALHAELDVTEIKHHSIPLDYIDGGLDATISTDGPDLKIRNPYYSDVTIEAKLVGLLLTVNIYGPHRDYTVDFSSVRTVSEETPAIEYYFNAVTAPDGTAIAPGASLTFREPRNSIICNVFKTRYYLDGKQIDSVLFEKVTYRSFTGLVYVNGPDPAIDSPNSEANPTPAPTPMPSAKVKESN